MGVCQCSNPPWDLPEVDNYCPGCGRPLKSLDVSPRTLSIVTDSENLGTGNLVLSNRTQNGVVPLNPVTVVFQTQGVKDLLDVRDEFGEQYESGDELSIGPDQSVSVGLSMREIPLEGEHYATLCLETTDPRQRNIEIKVGISPKAPELEWTDPAGEPIEGEVLCAFRLLIGDEPAGSAEPKSIWYRNKGGGYLGVQSVTPLERANWFEIGRIHPEPLRRGQRAKVDIGLAVDRLPRDPLDARVPFLIALSDGSEVTAYVRVVLSPPAKLVVEPLPPLELQADGSYRLEDCPPYTRRDFEIRLVNAGGQPLGIVGLEVDPGEAVRWYRGGDTRLQFGLFPPGQVTQLPPGDSTYGKLSVDLPKLRFDQEHAFRLRFQTDPKDAASPLTIVLRVVRRTFAPGHIPNYIGIDFGTSNSTVAVREDRPGEGESEYSAVVIDEGGALQAEAADKRDLPSILYFREVDDPLIGSPAAALGDAFPDRYLRSFKRTIGLNCPRRILGRTFTPEDLAEIIFTKLIAQATQALPYFTSRIVATCPANFADHQRRSTLRACQRALLRMILNTHADVFKQEVQRRYGELVNDDVKTYCCENRPAGLLLRDIAAVADKMQGNQFQWDPREPTDALLLLTYLAVDWKILMELEVSAGSALALGEEEMKSTCRDLAMRLLEPLAGPGGAAFSSPPAACLETQPGEKLSALLDRAMGLLVEVFANKLKLMDVQLLDEPTAAAFAYMMRNKDYYRQMPARFREYIAVYDFGGGTFDVSIAAIAKDEKNIPQVEVVRSDGLAAMGGDDLDFALIRNYLDHARPGPPHRQLIETSIYELRDKAKKLIGSTSGNGNNLTSVLHGKRRLKWMAEGDKIRFSEDQSLQKVVEEVRFTSPIVVQGTPSMELVRAEFERLIVEKVAVTVGKFKEVVNRARASETASGNEFQELRKVVLAGKTSRLPLVRKLMMSDRELDLKEEMFDGTLGDDEKACVAIGAAYFGHWKSGVERSGIAGARSRVLTQSVGIVRFDSYGDVFRPIPQLAKGTPIRDYLEARLDFPYEPEGKYEIAQSSGTHDSDVPWSGLEMTRLGTFGYARRLENARPDEEVTLTIRVDLNGLVTVAGALRGEPVGSFVQRPPGLRDKPVYVFI